MFSYLKWLIVFAILTVFILFSANNIRNQDILPSFIALEEKEATKDVQRCIDAIKREMFSLGQFANDWAIWDDSLQFVKDRNEKYIKANLNMNTLQVSTDIDLMVYINPKYEVVWGGIIREEDGELRMLPDLVSPEQVDFLPSLASVNQLDVSGVIDKNNNNASINGLVLTKEGPILLSSRPILQSDGKGVPGGIIVMGRFLSEEVTSDLIEQTSTKFSIILAGKNLSGKQQQVFRKMLDSGKTVLIEKIYDKDGKIDKNKMVGYGLLKDLNGKPAVIIEASLTRGISMEGERAANFATYSFIVAAAFVIFCLLLVLLMHIGNEKKRRRLIEHKVEQRTRELRAANNDLHIFKTSIEQSMDGVTIAEVSGEIIFANQAWEKMHGYETGEIIGRDIREFQSAKKDNDDKDISIFNKAMNEGSAEGETSHQRKDGSTFPALVSSAVIKDDDGDPQGLTALVRDITHRKQTEMALIHSEKLASVGTLAGGVAHEFNNINSSIIGYAELSLDATNLTKETRSYLQKLLATAWRAKEITDNLLSFSGKKEEKQQPEQLNQIINETVELVSKQWKTEGIKFSLDISEVPTVVVNRSQIGQVVLNLLINAKHSLKEQPVKLITIKTGSDEKSVWVEISDTGCGISEKDITNIFTPFFSTKGEHSVGNSSQSEIKGTGLGLSVSHTIIANNNGKITVKSKENEGSVFTIFFPKEEN